MKRFLVAAIALVAATRVALSDDFFEAGSEQHTSHLVPIGSFMDGFLADYDELLAKHLFAGKGRCGRMLVCPSFSPEYCLSVDEYPRRERQPGIAKGVVRYMLVVTTAAESIWYERQRAGGGEKPVHVQVSRVEREISRDLAVAIQRVWAKALLLTKYSPATNTGGGVFDGIRYQFSVWASGRGMLAGQTHSPEQGMPRELVNLGLEIVAFAKREAASNATTEQQLVEKLRKFEATIPQS